METFGTSSDSLGYAFNAVMALCACAGMFSFGSVASLMRRTRQVERELNEQRMDQKRVYDQAEEMLEDAKKHRNKARAAQSRAEQAAETPDAELPLDREAARSELGRRILGH